MNNQSLLSLLRERFPQAILAADEFRGALSVRLRPEDYFAVARWLRDDPALRYTFLENLCGVDYLGRTPRLRWWPIW